MEPEAYTMSVTDHVSQLRGRLLKIAIILTAGTVVAAAYSREIFFILQRPLAYALPDSTRFVALSPIEGWVVYLKIAFVAAIFATAPLWFYQLWAFTAPALVKHERRIVFAASIASTICFVAGGLFGYFVVLPTGFHYLVAIYDQTNIALYPQMNWYLSFILRALFAFGVVFETPVILVLLARFGIVSVARMRSARRYVIVGIFVFAAIITPGPDIFSQIAVAIPLVLFYELGIIAAQLCIRR